MSSPAARPDAVPAPDIHPESPETPTRTWIIRGVIALALVVGIVWGVRKFIYSQSHETTDDAQLAGHVIPVIPKVSGYIQKVYVNDNQPVKAGDTLVVLDPRDYQVALDRSEAELRSALAAGTRGSATAAVNVAEAQHAALAADVAVAQANFDRAEHDVQRFRDLAAKNIISAQQLDQAIAADKAAAAQLAAAQAQAVSGGANVTGANFEARNADFRVASLTAALNNARLQVAYTTLQSPINGITAKKNAEIGQYVQAGQQLLAIVETDTVWVVANVKETQMRDIKPGQDAEVTVDAIRGLTLHGKVQSIQDATGATFALLPPDNATGNFTKIVQRVPVKIALEKPSVNGRPLSPGLSVEVSIDTKSGTNR